MLIGERVVGGPEVLRAAGPAGIIAFEVLMPPPKPRLRPYVWSQEKAEQPGRKGSLAQIGALIVGPMGSLPRGEEVRES